MIRRSNWSTLFQLILNLATPPADERRAQRAGVSVTAISSDVSSATTIVRARARKNTPGTPVRYASGMKTTTGVSVLPISGRPTSWNRAPGGLRARIAGANLGVHGFHHNDRVIDHQADRRRDPAERH